MDRRKIVLDKGFKPMKETSTIPIMFLITNERTIEIQIQEHQEKRALMSLLLNQLERTRIKWVDYFVNKIPFEQLKKLLIARDPIKVFEDLFKKNGEFSKSLFERFVAS